MLLDDLMPRYDFDERHRIWVLAPPERVFDAVKQVTTGEMPLVRLLFGLRSLPAIFARRRGLPAAKTQPLYEQMLAFGFVLLAEEANREVVLGLIGQFWRLGGGIAPAIRDARDFVAFDAPGYAKAGMSFSLQPVERGTRLSTETRILTTDPASRRSFAHYWRVIYPSSAAIRRSWLRAVKRPVGAPH